MNLRAHNPIRCCGLWWLLVVGLAFSAGGGTPAISKMSIAGATARLNIISETGVTNQIQTATSLDQPVWTVLTNVLVTQSNYWFVDQVTSAATERFYRVLALRGGGVTTVTGSPPRMVLIPAGSFQMGDTFYEGESYELPIHSVYLSAFYMDKYEVSKGLWDLVKNWSTSHGYSFDNPGAGKGTNHPVQTINWYDMVKWCNARSEYVGRVPAYYTDAMLTQVYRTGQAAPYVNWHAGFRLPTEAEWEKGARGGASGHRFPWSNSDTISHSQANYYSDSSYSYDISPTRGYNPLFVDGVMPYTSPVGSFAANGYGLYDMSGNVWEWCWDWAGNYPSTPVTDPHGPDTGSTRVGKGGNWNYFAGHCRDAYRYGNVPTDSATNIGFRCALPAQ